jgi:hypothetical protein
MYEEKEADGILCYRYKNDNPWIPFTRKELLTMIKDIQNNNNKNIFIKRTTIKYKVREIIYDFLKKDNIDKICDKIFNSGSIDLDSINEMEYNFPKKIACVISQKLYESYASNNKDDISEIDNMYKML